VTVDAAVYVKFWYDALAAADAPGTHTNQDKPENHWEIHPVIDGCDLEKDDGGDDVPK